MYKKKIERISGEHKLFGHIFIAGDEIFIKNIRRSFSRRSHHRKILSIFIIFFYYEYQFFCTEHFSFGMKIITDG
jgi:hypothetical protein